MKHDVNYPDFVLTICERVTKWLQHYTTNACYATRSRRRVFPTPAIQSTPPNNSFILTAEPFLLNLPPTSPSLPISPSPHPAPLPSYSSAHSQAPPPSSYPPTPPSSHPRHSN